LGAKALLASTPKVTIVVKRKKSRCMTCNPYREPPIRKKAKQTQSNSDDHDVAHRDCLQDVNTLFSSAEKTMTTRLDSMSASLRFNKPPPPSCSQLWRPVLHTLYLYIFSLLSAYATCNSHSQLFSSAHPTHTPYGVFFSHRLCLDRATLGRVDAGSSVAEKAGSKALGPRHPSQSLPLHF
jgi:hypothetical protein